MYNNSDPVRLVGLLQILPEENDWRKFFLTICCWKSVALVVKQLIAVLIVLMLASLYTSIEQDLEIAQFRMGLLCCLMTIMFFAAPLTQLAHVVRTKNAESLPFTMIACTFIVCLQWLVYGIILGDPFIQIPNVIGLVLSAVQLSLFVIYPSEPSAP